MVYTINRPIIIRKYFSPADAYTYKKYTVAFKYIDDLTNLTTDWMDIYYGKAFVDADGYAEIEITDVVRNYANRPGYKYQNSTQKWVPENYVDLSTPITGFTPIESTATWRTTYFRVYETTTETWEEIIEITNLFFPETYGDGTIVNPYDSTCSEISPSVNHSDYIPHIPFVATDNYFVDIEALLGADAVSSNVTQIVLGSDYMGTSDTIFNFQGYGNYSASVNLNQFFGSFTIPTDTLIYGGGALGIADSIWGGAAISMFDYIKGTHSVELWNSLDAGDAQALQDLVDAGDAGSIYPLIYGYGAQLVARMADDVITGNNQELFAVDVCPARYYVSWITPFGEWQSQPLKAVSVLTESDNFNIKNTRRTMLNVENRSTATFQCKTTTLQPDKYRLFATMQYAPYVLLYDVQKDKNYYCVFDTGSTKVNYRVKTPEIFSFNLKQITTTIN